MGGHGRGDKVGLPDVHLGAAGAVATNAGVGIVGGGSPAFDVALAVDELQVTGTLGVTVARAVLGAGLVVLVLGHATVGVHGDKVESAVQTARQVGNVHIEGELLAQEVEHLVLRVGGHQEGTATDVLLRRRSDKVQSQGGCGGKKNMS